MLASLHRTPKATASVIHWPTQNTAISATRFPDVAAADTRAFSSASIELARIKAGDRR
jgi:hypothetical protein